MAAALLADVDAALPGDSLVSTLTSSDCRRASALERGRCAGFSTYGEQFRGIHVNQTLTGVAIGRRAWA